MTDREIDSRGEQAERQLTPDLLRGFGTLLVVLTNVPLILTPIRYQLVAGRNPFPGDLPDDLAVAVFLAVPTMTGMGMFVLAMGSGLADLLQGPGGHRRTARRLVVLGMLGLLHGLLVWWGDVLFYYLLAGLVALQFRHRPPRAQLAIGISITLLPLILTVADAFARGGVVRPEITEALSSAASMYESLGDRALSAYTSQDLAAVSGQRLVDWVTYAEDFALIGGVQLAGLFLVGIALARLRREDGLDGRFARAALGLSSAIALGAYAFQLSIQLFLPDGHGAAERSCSLLSGHRASCSRRRDLSPPLAQRKPAGAYPYLDVVRGRGPVLAVDLPLDERPLRGAGVRAGPLFARALRPVDGRRSGDPRDPRPRLSGPH